MQPIKKFSKSYIILETSGPDSFFIINHGNHSLKYDLDNINQYKAINVLLKKHERQLSSLDFIAVGVGPGKFTGTRIGVMIAKTLSYALMTPLISFCSLLVYVPKETGPFLICIDARSNEQFTLSGVVCEDTIDHEKPKLIKALKPTSKEVNTSYITTYVIKKYLNNDFECPLALDVQYLKNP